MIFLLGFRSAPLFNLYLSIEFTLFRGAENASLLLTIRILCWCAAFPFHFAEASQVAREITAAADIHTGRGTVLMIAI